jgi:hypothetical protein
MKNLRVSFSSITLLFISCVAAFVRHVTIQPKRPRYHAIRASSDDLKGFLDSSSYDSDIVKAYAGKTIKTAVKKAAKVSGSTYDLSVDDSSMSTTTVTPSPPPPLSMENIKDVLLDTPTATTTTTVTPQLSPLSSPIDGQIESMTQSVKETFSKSSSSSGDAKNLMEGFSFPSNLQEATEKPFYPLNHLLKSTEESIKEAQRVAAGHSVRGSAAAAANGPSATEKVPSMTDFMIKPLSNRQASLEVVSDKHSVDVKIPEMPKLQLPLVDKVAEVTPPTISSSQVRVTEMTLPEPGKALTFGEYIRAKFAGALPDDGSSTVSTMTDIKAKFAVMVANFYRLIGEDVPESMDDIQFPTLQDLSTLVQKLVKFDFKQLFDAIPESAPWGAVVLGTFLVVAGARKNVPAASAKENAQFVAPQSMEAATHALGGLTEDLVGQLQVP